MNTILITGASSGIGKATAIYFATHGWKVIATMRNPKFSKALGNQPNITLLALDVTQPHTIKRSIDTAVKKFKTIDVVVNNAGFGFEGPFEGVSPQQSEDIFATNVTGIFNVTRAILPIFRKQKRGTIINISSMGGRTTFPFYALYHATKWAVEGFSESLSYELAPLGIRVKLIEPGVIHTDFYRKMAHVDPYPVPKEYLKYLKKTVQQKETIRRLGALPDTVAYVVYQAAIDSSSRLRYTVGWDAFVLTIIRKFFPDGLYQWIVQRSMR